MVNAAPETPVTHSPDITIASPVIVPIIKVSTNTSIDPPKYLVLRMIHYGTTVYNRGASNSSFIGEQSPPGSSNSYHLCHSSPPANPPVADTGLNAIVNIS